MLNPIECLERVKLEINKKINSKTIIAFSNTPLPENISKTAIIEIKNIKQFSITITIKAIVNKLLGHEACLKLSSKIASTLALIPNYSLIECHTMPMSFDASSKNFFQETQATLKELTEELNSTLIFDSEKLTTHKNTVLKIERQISNLGTNLGNFQFFEFQKPIKKIEGCAEVSLNQFKTLLDALNSKKIAPLSFKNQTFDATLIELAINQNNIANFKFLESKNEN